MKTVSHEAGQVYQLPYLRPRVTMAAACGEVAHLNVDGENYSLTRVFSASCLLDEVGGHRGGYSPRSQM